MVVGLGAVLPQGNEVGGNKLGRYVRDDGVSVGMESVHSLGKPIIHPAK